MTFSSPNLEFTFSHSAKEPRQFVVTRKGANFRLGTVRFWPQWRQYVFEPDTVTVFGSPILREIADFCDSTTEKWLQLRLVAQQKLPE